MTFCENAGLIEDLEEIKQIIDEEYTNPTVDRMMFLEVKPKEGQENKLFPCYIEGWVGDKEGNMISLRVCIVQTRSGEFTMVRVNIPVEEINVKKRFWDKPAKKAVRDETEWVAMGVVEAGKEEEAVDIEQ